MTKLNQKLNIVFHSMGMAFDGNTVSKASLGGSESACYYQARELAKRGHRVSVFSNCKEPMSADGVQYVPLGSVGQEAPLGSDFTHYARHTPHDVLIIQRHPLAFHGTFASKINVWQLHDLALLRLTSAVNQMLWNVDYSTCVSEWHKSQVCEVYGLDPNFVEVVLNGVDPELYTDKSIKIIEDDWATHFTDKGLHVAKKAFNMLYQSRPERGLEHLIRPGGIMDRLRDTRAHLLIAGYDNTTAEMAPLYEKWFTWAKALPNVTHLGALTKKQLAALQKSCDLLCYPTEFEEVSCITAMEAMHAGLPMLTTNAGALTETCAHSGTEIIELIDGKVNEDGFVKQIEYHSEAATRALLEDYSDEQHEAAKRFTWASAVDRFEDSIARRLEMRRGSLSSRVRYSIEQSDIGPAAEMLEDYDGLNDICNAALSELHHLYAFAKSNEAYAAHYAKHQGIYYDGPGARAIGEDVTGSTRFRGVFHYMMQALGKPNSQGLRVLDYGCAHGHYLMPLAHVFKQHDFVGMDISERAIEGACKWANDEKMQNIELIIGNDQLLHEAAKVTYYTKEGEKAQDWLCPRARSRSNEVVNGSPVTFIEYGQPQLFDVILAGEVVEHVPDYLDLLEKLRMLLRPGGVLIITTPVGRWEWTGTKAFRSAREHLWHFDREDITELCGDNPVDLIFAPASQDQTGRPLGSWVWRVTNKGPFREYDRERKLASIVPPRQTISACLIVKDGEAKVRRCIESFIDWVDEVIVAIDPTTTDSTREVLEKIKREFPYKAFSILDGISAVEKGFDAARNLTVEEACGDWVLWLDADEEVQMPWNLWKYARLSQHRAFGFPQVHYACDPPQVLTTDYPCRLFRNDRTIKFYGLVHEHPETEPGKAIPHATIRHDVQFLHSGYVDENVRRERFQRNLPLLTRDMQAYPQRKLNQFLWLRDIAQNIVFATQRQGGVVTEAQMVQAREGVLLFQKMLESYEGNSRMILDAVQYYSQCVSTLRIGFEAKLSFSMVKEPINDLAATCKVEGRFHSFDCYIKLVNSLLKEGAKHYESKYL